MKLSFISCLGSTAFIQNICCPLDKALYWSQREHSKTHICQGIQQSMHLEGKTDGVRNTEEVHSGAEDLVEDKSAPPHQWPLTSGVLSSLKQPEIVCL